MWQFFGLAVGVFVLAVGLVGPSTANAQGTGVTCIFDNGRVTLSPGIQDAVPDLSSPGVQGPLDVERGDYFFSSDDTPAPFGTLCGFGTDIGGDAFVGTTAEISSDGHYDNIVCGTGFAHDLDGSGTAITATGMLGNFLSISGIGYEIQFKNLKGDLRIGPDGAPSLSETTELLPPDSVNNSLHAADGVGQGLLPGAMHGFIASDWVGEGEVVIKPAGSGNCVLSPNRVTDAFEVEGYFTMQPDP